MDRFQRVVKTRSKCNSGSGVLREQMSRKLREVSWKMIAKVKQYQDLFRRKSRGVGEAK